MREIRLPAMGPGSKTAKGVVPKTLLLASAWVGQTLTRVLSLNAAPCKVGVRQVREVRLPILEHRVTVVLVVSPNLGRWASANVSKTLTRVLSPCSAPPNVKVLKVHKVSMPTMDHRDKAGQSMVTSILNFASKQGGISLACVLTLGPLCRPARCARSGRLPGITGTKQRTQ